MVFADAGVWIVSALIVFVVMMVLNIVLGIITVGLVVSGGFALALIFRFLTIALVMAVSYILIANTGNTAGTATLTFYRIRAILSDPLPPPITLLPSGVKANPRMVSVIPPTQRESTLPSVESQTSASPSLLTASRDPSRL